MTYNELVQSCKNNDEAKEKVKERLYEELCQKIGKDEVQFYHIFDAVQVVEELLNLDGHYLFSDISDLIDDMFKKFGIAVSK